MGALSTTLTKELHKRILIPFVGAALAAILIIVGAASAANAEETRYEFGGHVKTRLLADWFPDNSAFEQLTGSSALDVESDLRLNFQARNGPWTFDAAWQLYAGYGDRIEYTRSIPGGGLFVDRLPNDDRRLFNLTDVLRDEDKFAALHRLDRLWVGYTSNKVVLQVGRQAITWGNGLIFSPMDIVNPFDPTAVDTEYKAGDDMVYGQYLRDNGDDVQAAAVFRRDPLTGDYESREGTTAVKYHGITNNAEFDFLIARSYEETTFGFGGNRSIGGAVWRGDIVVSDTEFGHRTQLVTSLSHSWTWGEKNMSGVVEYYFSDFGQKNGDYDLTSLLQNPALLSRLQRGESFTLGRNYLAGGVTIEMTPLWMLTPNLFANLDDGSALMQVVTRNSLSDNSEFLGALNIPLGPSGTEFGGINAGLPDVYFSTDLSLFAQFAWYF